MAFPEPQPGLVIRYSYQWWNQARRGQEEGEKDRPCAIILTVLEADGRKRVLLAPITHTPPGDPARAVELPIATKKRLGLSDRPSWVITDELNRFTWPGPDVRPAEPGRFAKIEFGLLPAALFEEIKTQIRANAKIAATKTVNRDA